MGDGATLAMHHVRQRRRAAGRQPFGETRLCDWDGCDEPAIYREGVHLTCGSHRIRPESRLAKGTA